MHGELNAFFTFYVDVPQEVVVNGYYIALFGDAGENSTVDFSDFQVIGGLPSGYCGR